MTLHSARRHRVLFLNRSYWPDAEATGQLLTELSEDMAPTFDITVITGQPNQNPDKAPYRQLGMQRRRGVEIRRVFNFQFPKASLLGRVINLLSYLVTASFAAILAPRPSILVVETDPPLLSLLGAFLKHWHRCRLVVYLQDIYPDLAVALGKLTDGWFTRCLRRLLFGIYRRADRVVVLSQDMHSVLASSGVSPGRIVCIPNWADTAQVYPIKTANPFRKRHGIDEQFVVMYSGNMGLSQRLENLLKAADRLRDRSDIVLLLVGDGAAKRRLKDLAHYHRLPNVLFLPYQPKSALAQSLSAADLHMVLVDARAAEFLMPSKLYGILASGTPVLAATRETCELASIIRRARVGLVVPDHAKSLDLAIRWTADNRDELSIMGQRARHLAVQRYDRSEMTSRFSRMLCSLQTAQANVLN